jgi:succinyl-CoA synthetase beta subunit
VRGSSKYGVPTQRGFPAFSVEEAVEAAKKLGGSVWVVRQLSFDLGDGHGIRRGFY